MNKSIVKKILSVGLCVVLGTTMVFSTSCAIGPRAYQERAEEARSALSKASGEKQLTSFGDLNLSAESKKDIEDAIKKITDSGRMVSFISVDLMTDKGIAYNPDQKTTSQSTIKGPYLASALDEDATRFNEENLNDFKQTITVSSGPCYEKLRTKFGSDCLLKWCRELSISDTYVDRIYPRNITARDMAKIWTKMYEFLNTHDDLNEFVSYFTGTKFSAIYHELGNEYKIQSKPGWENGTGVDALSDVPRYDVDAKFLDGDPTNDEVATNDAGIVYSGDKPYILVIFTNCSSDYARLQPLVRAIDNAHTEEIGK